MQKPWKMARAMPRQGEDGGVEGDLVFEQVALVVGDDGGEEKEQQQGFPQAVENEPCRM